MKIIINTKRKKESLHKVAEFVADWMSTPNKKQREARIKILEGVDALLN